MEFRITSIPPSDEDIKCLQSTLTQERNQALQAFTSTAHLRRFVYPISALMLTPLAAYITSQPIEVTISLCAGAAALALWVAWHYAQWFIQCRRIIQSKTNQLHYVQYIPLTSEYIERIHSWSLGDRDVAMYINQIHQRRGDQSMITYGELEMLRSHLEWVMYLETFNTLK